jgi:heme/copper-type cytochrome/quinol oxidase subunit 4
MFVMLVCAYIELILPIFTIGGSFLFKNDAKHIWGSNLPGLGCITAGSIYLALYYGDNLTMSADTDMMFKAHVGIAIAMCIIGALLIIQVTLSFIGVLHGGDCCSGERAVGLFAYIFTMIGLAIVFAIPIGTMAIGWTYAFGDCSDEKTFDQVMRALAVCPTLD